MVHDSLPTVCKETATASSRTHVISTLANHVLTIIVMMVFFKWTPLYTIVPAIVQMVYMHHLI